jgi:hypothetical protein
MPALKKGTPASKKGMPVSKKGMPASEKGTSLNKGHAGKHRRPLDSPQSFI